MNGLKTGPDLNSREKEKNMDAVPAITAGKEGGG